MMEASFEYLILILWIPAFVMGTIFYHKKVSAHFRYFQIVNNAFVGYKDSGEYFRSFSSNGLKENFRETIMVSIPLFFRNKSGEEIAGNSEIKTLVRKVIVYNWVTIVCMALFLTEIYLQI